MKNKVSCLVDLAVGNTDLAAAALAAVVRIGKVGATAAPMPPATLNQLSQPCLLSSDRCSPLHRC